jgi:predicted amidohydrolase
MVRSRMVFAFALALLLLSPGLPPRAAPAGEGVDIAAVQFEVSEALYTEHGAFAARAEAVVAEAAAAGADLVVFPEYINVFLLFEAHASLISRARDLSDALAALASDEAAPVAALQHLMLRRSPAVERRMRAMWAGLAREHDVAVIAGSGFVRTDGGELRNRALVFDDDGRLVHLQDKVYLTPVEDELLGLEPGDMDAVSTFEVEGLEVGLTICRDSYFDAFEERLAGADLWVQLRANGEAYGPEVRRRFEGALAERVAETPVPAGIDASLTGSFLDLLWEGPAYAVDADGRRIAETEDERGSGIVLLRFRADGSRATLRRIWRLQQ